MGNFVPGYRVLHNLLLSFLYGLLTLTYSGETLGRHMISGVCSKNGLITSEVAVNHPVILAPDDCHNNRTKIKVIKLY